MNGNDAKEQAANAAHVHAVEQAAAQALVEEKESESRSVSYTHLTLPTNSLV